MLPKKGSHRITFNAIMLFLILANSGCFTTSKVIGKLDFVGSEAFPSEKLVAVLNGGQPVSAESCKWWPLFLARDARLVDAIEEAGKNVPNADGLLNVKVDYFYMIGVLYNKECYSVSGIPAKFQKEAGN